MRTKSRFRMIINLTSVIIVLALAGCSEKNSVTAPSVQNTNLETLAKHGIDTKFAEFILVSDTSYKGARIDANLGNAWGITVTPTGIFWISANHTGVSTIYDSAGNQKISPVTIPTVN